MLVTILQSELGSWGAYADRYGLPLLMLAVIILFFWKLFWPLLVKAQNSLEVQVVEARATRERDTDKFLNSLAARDVVNDKQTKAIDALTDRIDEIKRTTPR